jgi:hypothetical protein
MTADLIQARRALRLATLVVHWAQNDFDRAVAQHHRAQAARALRSALNVEKPSMFHRRQAG